MSTLDDEVKDISDEEKLKAQMYLMSLPRKQRRARGFAAKVGMLPTTNKPMNKEEIAFMLKTQREEKKSSIIA